MRGLVGFVLVFFLLVSVKKVCIVEVVEGGSSTAQV